MSASDQDNVSVHTAFRLNDLYVEPDALRISGERAECVVEPKVMALLVALCGRPGQLSTRNELQTRLWNGRTGSDESLTRIVYQLRKALNKAALAGNVIKSVPRLGYRLDAEVQRGAAANPEVSGQLATRPFSIAVLPVSDVSAVGENQFLADGLTRDLTTLLSRTPRFWVAPYSSASQVSNNSAGKTSIARDLQVRYLVTAALSRSGEAIRIRVELSDAIENQLLWSEKFDAVLDRFFEVQEEVACNISTAIAAKVNVTQPERVRRSGLFNLSAYERIQAAEALRLNYGRESAGRIVSMLQQALDIKPNNPAVRAALAMQLSQNVVSQWEADPVEAMARADALIAEALAAAPHDPDVLTAAGVVATMFHRPDEAIQKLEQAIAMNPNDAHALAVLGWQLSLRHADPEGIKLIETAEARAPHHPRFGLWATYRATGHLFMLDYAAGLHAGQQALARTPNYYQPHLNCAWAYTGLGDTVSAVREIGFAQQLDANDILGRYVAEMRKWSANSPNKAQCWQVLDQLQHSL